MEQGRGLARRLLLAATLCAGVARAEEARVAFAGRVVDPGQTPLGGAAVTAIPANDAAAVAAAATSGRDGRFVLRLAAGDYSVRVQVQGFADLWTPVTVRAGDNPVRDFVLQTPAVEEAITVRAPGGYVVQSIDSATRVPTPLRDTPQSVTVVTRQLMQDQLMSSLGDVVRYVPGVQLHQGENNRDQVVLRGNSSSADFFVDGVRDDVQYYRDLYNLERVEALKGPNAMIFGRGGGGGVINRVTKEAGFDDFRELDLQAGSFGNRRATADLEHALGATLALRVNGVYEDSGSFRDGVDLERHGVAPALTWVPSDATRVTLGYEHFADRRTADRGITSFRGRPAEVGVETYFGNPDDSRVRADVDLLAATVQHSFGALTLRNRTLHGDYDRGYQNYVPGAVSADGRSVSISAYNNATRRRNTFNQTDLTWTASAGTVKHTLLAGTELGRQRTANFRNTGFFANNATSVLVPLAAPTLATRAAFRQSATDADNALAADVAAVYLQDQIALGPRLELVAGVRLDRFALDFRNHRNGDRFERTDDLVSPRLGVVVRPTGDLSLYASGTVSYLPGSGDQFSSLTTVTKELEPEKFRNLEVGAKWELARGFALTGALYRLDRSNTRSTDPNDPTRIVQTGSQRTDGLEIGLNGQLTERWSVAGGYAYQDAFVTHATASARKGATVGQVPRHTFSLWNQLQWGARWGTALGLVCRSAMFATIDDSVTLPGAVRVDAAVYYTLTSGIRAQVNVENLFDRRLWANADSNTNLSPGSPRVVRVGVSARF